MIFFHAILLKRMWGIVVFLRPCRKWLRDEFSTGPQTREDLLKTITLNTGPFILKISQMFYFFLLDLTSWHSMCVCMSFALCQIVVTFITLTFFIYFFVVVHPWFLQTGHLAMETLLSLTSKRAGDWFKEELRLLGGLDHIVDKGWLYSDVFWHHGASCRLFWPLWLCFSTVKECVENLNQEEDEEKLVSSLWGAERCLRVLESVSELLRNITLFGSRACGWGLKKKKKQTRELVSKEV